MNMLDHWLSAKLDKRKLENSFRKLGCNNPSLVDFTSNDYLGLAHTSELHQAIQQKVEQQLSLLNGATGSRLLSGNSPNTEAVEAKLANIFVSDRTLLFNSGYVANMAVLSSIPQRGDTVLFDERAHACMKDGIRLSLANRFSFKHNDLHDLESKLKKASGNIFIAVESVYSMDGDECPLNGLLLLANQYKAVVIIDEAHSTGVYGKDGGGLAISLGVHTQIAIRIYTFGKGMGVHGACVAGSEVLINYLINFARPFIYTTALPPHSVVAIECAFDFLHTHPDLQQQLQERIARYVQLTSGWNTNNSKSAIQTVLIPGNSQVRKAAMLIQKKGFDVRPILSPTVQAGTERLRICLHTYNKLNEIEELVNVVEEVMEEVKV